MALDLDQVSPCITNTSSQADPHRSEEEEEEEMGLAAIGKASINIDTVMAMNDAH